jgi:hypothetical protein
MRDDLLDYDFLDPTKLITRLRAYFKAEVPEFKIYTSKMKSDGIVISTDMYGKDTIDKVKICYMWAHYNECRHTVGYKFYYQRDDDGYLTICDYSELQRHIKMALTRERVYMVRK